MGRQPCCDKIGLKRGPWTIEEDRKLMSFIFNNGIQCWRHVPKLAGLMRCGKSCRLRWINYLRPDLKRGALTEAEEDMIIQLHSRFGNRWSKIASHFPGRTDNEIKNHWNTTIKKKLKNLGLNPITHEPIPEQETISKNEKENVQIGSSQNQETRFSELNSHDNDGDQISKMEGSSDFPPCGPNNYFNNNEIWDNSSLRSCDTFETRASDEFSVGINGQNFDDFFQDWILSPNDMLLWDNFNNFDEIFLNSSPNMDGTNLQTKYS